MTNPPSLGEVATAYRIAVMGGDGVGPELVTEALRVLDRLAALDGFACEIETFPHSAEHYGRTGVTMDAATLAAIGACDSILFGAAGADELPGVMEEALVHRPVEHNGCHIGVRPAYLHSGRLSPLKGLDRGDIDCVIVRDTLEGELVPAGTALNRGTEHEAVTSLVMHTRRGVERTLRYGFELARLRRRKVSLVVQSNALIAHRIWPEVMETVAAGYPDVETELLYPDHAAMRFVTRPGEYDVIVSSLMLGGIMTDLVAATVGGIGLIGSVRLNTDTGFGFFEPAHGSAPKYTGTGRVSPIATLTALSMLLENLGEHVAAARLRRAIDVVLAEGTVPDAGTRNGMSMTAVTDHVLAAIDRTGDDPAAGSGMSQVLLPATGRRPSSPVT